MRRADLREFLVAHDPAPLPRQGGQAQAQQATQEGSDHGQVTDAPLPGQPRAELVEQLVGPHDAAAPDAEPAIDHRLDGPPPHHDVRLLDRMARALPQPVTLMKIVSAAATVSLANAASRMQTGRGLPQVAALGVSAIGAAVAGAMLFKEMRALREEQRAVAALRRPDLAGRPLGEVMGRLMEGSPDRPAASFDWSAPGLFVDAEGRDMAADVAHVFARSIDSASRMPPDDAALVLVNLALLADGLTEPDLRSGLANTVSEANGQCQDRLGVSLGQLIMAVVIRELRQPDAPPAVIVGGLSLYAATRAASAFVHDIVGPDAEPSAELMLHACHAVEAGLLDVGIFKGDMFPRPQFEDPADMIHYDAVNEWADELTAGLVKPLLGRLAPDTGAVVDLLTNHGGTEFEEIFSSRLAHHIEPAMELLRRRDEQLQADKDQMADSEYLSQCRQLMQDSQDVRRRIYEKAVRSAFFETSGVWDEPARPVPA